MSKMATGLTIERHRELGAELHQMRETLNALVVELWYAYPVRSKQRIELHRALLHLDVLRSELEGAMFRECPSERSLDIYYPNRELEP